MSIESTPINLQELHTLLSHCPYLISLISAKKIEEKKKTKPLVLFFSSPVYAVFWKRCIVENFSNQHWRSTCPHFCGRSIRGDSVWWHEIQPRINRHGIESRWGSASVRQDQRSRWLRLICTGTRWHHWRWGLPYNSVEEFNFTSQPWHQFNMLNWPRLCRR